LREQILSSAPEARRHHIHRVAALVRVVAYLAGGGVESMLNRRLL